MSTSPELEVDRLREKFPRSYKALVQLYPFVWNEILGVLDQAVHDGKTASVVAGKLSILRGLEKSTRRWVVLSIAADRREIMMRGQKSFLTQLHDRSLDDILAELNALEAKHSGSGAAPAPPNDGLPRGFVFISHHRTSQGKLALEIAEGLEASGQKCWVAPRDVPFGSNWNEEVYGAAQRCGSLILLHSREAHESKVVQGEVHIVVGRGVPVLVVRLCESDPARLNVGLAAYQHMDWRDRPQGEIEVLRRRLHAALEGAQTAKTDAA